MAQTVSPVKVYGLAMSTCTKRVLTALEEKNVPYDLIVVDLFKGAHKQPDFLKLQPFGKIPVLVDGDVTIFESRTIVRYIAKKWANQGTDLLGSTEKQQALTDNWLEAEAQYYNPSASTIVAEKVFKPNLYKVPTDEAEVAKQLVELNKTLDVYEKHLSTSAYLAGPEFSLADLSHLPYTNLLFVAGITEPFDSRPHLKAWWEKISSRPTWKKVVAL